MDLSETKNLPKVDHTPAVLDEPAKILLKAADYIEAHGWCQNHYEDSSRRTCALGAIGWRSNRSPSLNECTAVLRLEKHLGKTTPSWNDEPGRTQEEVIAKLRSVALGL